MPSPSERLTALLDETERDDSPSMRAIARQIKQFFAELVRRDPMSEEAIAEALTLRWRVSLELALYAQAEAAGVNPLTEH